LIVEDDGQYLALLKRQLQASGYSIIRARTGPDALEKARANPPWLILLDLHMPVMDGLQFRLAQVADPLLADIPVVMISADHEAAEIGRRLGAAGVVLKAEDRRLVVDLIAAHVPK
jgi:CheY-like chemotaxis protein